MIRHVLYITFYIMYEYHASYITYDEWRAIVVIWFLAEDNPLVILHCRSWRWQWWWLSWWWWGKDYDEKDDGGFAWKYYHQGELENLEDYCLYCILHFAFSLNNIHYIAAFFLLIGLTTFLSLYIRQCVQYFVFILNFAFHILYFVFHIS